ncbi:MAG: hypothetical protein ABIG63_13625 [Chloroflexota bacterium]
MSKLYRKPPWVVWPNRKYATDINDLARMGIRCDLWREFFSSPALDRLNRLRGHIIWFNRHQAFDVLICEFDCSESRLTKAIKEMMRPAREVVFKRNDIYDPRAWAYLPLDCFLDVHGLKPRGKVRDQWLSESEILRLGEIPLIHFGVKKAWVVNARCFTSRHRMKDGRRFGQMTFSHADLDGRFENKRWVADGWFAKEASGKQVHDVLLSQVKEKCVRCLVTIEK